MCLDRILLKKAQNGDIEAVEKLLRRYERYVFNTALGFFKNPYDASDAAQEAMLKIYQKINSFRGDASFRSWIFRITINVCKDILRKTKDVLATDEDSIINAQVDSMTPEQVLTEKLDRERVIEAIMQLDEDFRNGVILKELNDQSYEEIARQLDISEGTVKSRLFRARNKLKELLA